MVGGYFLPGKYLVESNRQGFGNDVKANEDDCFWTILLNYERLRVDSTFHYRLSQFPFPLERERLHYEKVVPRILAWSCSRILKIFSSQNHLLDCD